MTARNDSYVKLYFFIIAARESTKKQAKIVSSTEQYDEENSRIIDDVPCLLMADCLPLTATI